MLAGVKRFRIVVPVLLAVAAALWWMAARPNRAHTFTLPDGNRLFFHAVTVGSNVPVNFGSAMEQALGRLPGKVGRKYRRNVWTDESTTETLVFWFQFERAAVSNSVDVQFVDPERNRKFQSHMWLAAYTLPNGKVIATCGLPVWPRQDKAFTVRISYCDPDKANGDEGERHELGVLTVANPRYEPERARD